MKIVNKKTGEVIDLSSGSESKKDSPNSKLSATEKRIEERGAIQDSVKKIGKKGVVNKVSGVLETASAPLAAIESGIANPMLEMQKGNFNQLDLLKKSILGLSLQRQGQYGDVMKNAGYNPLLADSAGLLLNLSPAKVYLGVAKTFGNISKMSDKGLMKAGSKIVEAADEARAAVGKKVGEAFTPHSTIGVDGLKFLDDVAEIPKPVLNKLEVAFGKMEDFAKGLTVGKLREFKTYLGKLKPNSFGQAEHGIQESLDVKDLSRAYGKVRERVYQSLKDAKVDEKVSQHLMNLEDSFSSVMDARRFIKRSVVDPTLNVPSRVGTFAESVTKGVNPTARLALSEIKRASSKAMSNVNKAMVEIESFERWQAAKQMTSHAVKAAVYGGVAGGIGGAILRKVNETSD